jgi:hypothetical protein
VAPPDQRTPAGRLLPVTLGAVSAADTGRPDTRPRFRNQQRTGGRCRRVQFPSHRDTAPASCGVRGGHGCRRTAAVRPSRWQRDGHRPPCAPARRPGQPARVAAAGGQRRSGRAEADALADPGSRPVSGVRRCGHRRLGQGRADTAAGAMLDSRQQNRPPRPQRPTRNGTATCGAGQHRHGLTARFVVWRRPENQRCPTR